MGTKRNHGSFDCYANAEPDEPMFVLLARDEQAPERVRDWVRRRAQRKGLMQLDLKSLEALDCADAMELWLERHTDDLDEIKSKPVVSRDPTLAEAISMLTRWVGMHRHKRSKLRHETEHFLDRVMG